MHHLLTGVSFSLFTNFFLLTHQHSLYIMPSSTLSQPKHHQHNAVQYNIMEACSIHNAFLYIISMQPIICHIIYVQYISCKINGLEFMIFIFLLLIFHSPLSPSISSRFEFESRSIYPDVSISLKFLYS